MSDELKEKIEFKLMELVEKEHFGKPRDEYDPTKNFTIFANYIFGRPEDEIYELVKNEVEKLETQLKETQDLLVEACEYVVTLNEEICKSKYDCYSIDIKNFLDKPKIKQLLEQRIDNDY